MSLMMSSGFNTKSFKKLKSEWYKKLKDSGFKDAEVQYGEKLDSDGLDQYHVKFFTWIVKTRGVEFFKMKQEYYMACTHFSNTHSFSNDLDETVWRLHSDGLSLRETAAIMKKKGFLINKDKVAVTIKRLFGVMKLHGRKPTR